MECLAGRRRAATVTAAAARLSDRELAASFARTAVAGATFHVEARPIDRLDDRVLSTDAGRREGSIVGADRTCWIAGEAAARDRGSGIRRAPL
ncbi:MAG TPA: hypothetical protein VFT22_12285 [Kofleriaceae bacterium]|nr:hypothetical protein [Kofleriaceae bacterium]